MLYYCRCGKQTLCREETEERHQSGSGQEASWLHRGPAPNIVEAALMLPLAEAPPWPPAGLRALGAGVTAPGASPVALQACDPINPDAMGHAAAMQ